MLSILSLLLVLTFSILVTRIATVALTQTGLSNEAARFQARSAFTGVGFTTTEAEKVVNHPVRRRVLMLLMLLGNAGIATAIASMMLTFVNTEEQQDGWFWRVVLIVAGVVALWAISQSSFIDRHLSRVIAWALSTTTDIDTRDYARLLHLGGDFTVTEVMVQQHDWMAGSTLAELNLREEGILVLGVHNRDGEFQGIPTGRTRVRVNDTLVVYGRQQKINELSQRRRSVGGELQHLDAISEQKHLEAESMQEEQQRDVEEGERAGDADDGAEGDRQARSD